MNNPLLEEKILILKAIKFDKICIAQRHGKYHWEILEFKTKDGLSFYPDSIPLEEDGLIVVHITKDEHIMEITLEGLWFLWLNEKPIAI